MNAFVVLNPVSGQDDPGDLKDLFVQYASEERCTYDLYETTGEEDLQQVVRKALKNDYDLVVACGGDGTVSAVVDGVANQDVPLGIIPRGTGNAFAAELKLPKTAQDALDLILGEHQLITSDAVQIEDRFFVLYCSLGITSSAIKDTSREEKNHLGWLAYLVNGLKELVGLRPIKMNFLIDGQRQSFHAAEAACFNSDATGVLKRNLDLGVSMTDGRLDLYAVRSRTIWDFLRIILHVITRTSREDPHVRYWPVHDSVEISTSPSIVYQADGDLHGQTPFTAKVAKGAFRVVAPQNVKSNE